MTPRDLRTRLAELLEDQLGTYDRPSPLPATPAIWVDEPPSTYRARGLELVISSTPRATSEPTTGRRAYIRKEWEVRVIPRGQGAWPAVERILATYPSASVTQIPQNEPLGILEQFVITIPASTLLGRPR